MSITTLKVSQELRTELGSSCEVKQLLGIGSQGEVYQTIAAGKPMALKWYLPRFATPQQRQALRTTNHKRCSDPSLSLAGGTGLCPWHRRIWVSYGLARSTL